MKSKRILLIDAAINLILGILLIAFSQKIVTILGVPDTEQYFYPTILGGVLFGIGIALIVEWYRADGPFTGLGIGGAISINMCGGLVLAFWLLFGKLTIPLGGRIFLWILVLILFGISSIELWMYHSAKESDKNKI